MPFLLEQHDLDQVAARYGSVLVVPCRFCPAASAAVRHDDAYMRLHRGHFKTASYEQELNKLRVELEDSGVRTGVFKSRLAHQFVLCMWSARRRRHLRRVARRFEAVLVLGCEAATETVRRCVDTSATAVVSGMRSVGFMSLQPRVAAPLSILIEMESLTPIATRP